MAESISIDLSPIIRAINGVNSNLNIVNNNVSRVDNNVRVANQNIEIVRRQTMGEINKIKAQLVEMERKQKFQAAFQRAISEIIRVRQELERDYGNQKLVRDSMLGILQATDTALISEQTISRCTEELMISTPKYWLAPCLIALAAWIANNESLAKRAVKEACKRDREKTCLLFALISRRVNAGRMQSVNAGRMQKGKKSSDATFEWLAEYFKLQDPFKMRRSIIAYIDAYSNGVFGYDKDNLCEDHISHWMDKLMEGNPSFAEEQKTYWKNKFRLFQDNSTVSFPVLNQICPQYDNMIQYIGRIDASERDDGIKNYIGNIVNEPVDLKKLICDVDNQLMKLVSNYEEGEEELRYEEQELELIKKFEGDEDRAKRIIKGIRESNVDLPVDFAKQLSQAVFQDDGSTSAKKSAIKLLKPYISEAFKEFMLANKKDYPKEVDFNINESGNVFGSPNMRNGSSFVWTGSTENGENEEELVDSISEKYEQEKEKTLNAISDDDANKRIKTGKICCYLGFLVIPLFVGISKIKSGKRELAQNENDRNKITSYYDFAQKKSVELLSSALEERKEANELVKNFASNKNSESIVI